MSFFSKKPQLPLVVVASRDPKAFESFLVQDARVVEVVTTRGLVRAIEDGPALIVVDIDDVVETSDLSRDALRFAINTAQLNGIPVIDTDALGQGKVDIATLSQAKTSAGVRYVLPKVVVLTNYAGGLGKTTLTLAMAKAFVRATGLGAAVIEAGVGAGAMTPKLGIQQAASMYEIITQKATPRKWEGVDLYPSSMREAQVLAGDHRLAESFRSITQSHTLTIFDASPLSPLWAPLLNVADEIIVITTPRGDTIAQADATYREVKELLSAQGSNKKLSLVMNMATSFTDRVSLGSDLGAWVPMNEAAAKNFGEELALPVLSMLYTGFERLAGKKESKNIRRPAPVSNTDAAGNAD